MMFVASSSRTSTTVTNSPSTKIEAPPNGHPPAYVYVRCRR